MSDVIYVRSEEGSYFEIGKTSDGNLFLKNRCTEIPNEFGMYDKADVAKLFTDICERIPECDVVERVTGGKHKNAYMRVIYSDGTNNLYEETDRGLNLAAFTTNIADYNEFAGEWFFGSNPQLVSLTRLRQVCHDKREFFDIFFKAVDSINLGCDDYMDMKARENEDGSVSIDEYIYCRISKKDFVTLDANGYIQNTGGLKYVELLKKHNVKVIR